ncbi:unnamed protein product, partial [Sphacelaria rigidula]
QGDVEVREGSIMKTWKRKQLSMARGLMAVSSPHGEIHKQKSISLDGMVLERGCKR